MTTTTVQDIGNILWKRISLDTLPYDLLLNITQQLDMRDILALQSTCKTLYDFARTRSVYRHLALSLLRRCRALPLTGFRRLSDLSTEELASAVTRAHRLELDWLRRTPKPCYSSALTVKHGAPPTWYKIIQAPSNEDIDWLSPITSNYTLCATRSGKVICWDVLTDSCIAEWDPQDKWELWKCRVQFETRTVYFTMARVLNKSLDTQEGRIMEFILVKLEFPAESNDRHRPTFSKLSTFRTNGVVMNIFLLDPAIRLLSAFIWVASSNSIGLFVLPDWGRPEYVFVDTGIECTHHANWSCIAYKENIVVHTEDSEAAIQYFYPVSYLKQHLQRLPDLESSIPILSTHLPPLSSSSAQFIFPSLTPASPTALRRFPLVPQLLPIPLPANIQNIVDQIVDVVQPPPAPPMATIPLPAEIPPSNPFPYPLWLPESAHFVRQWWPTMPIMPRLSCTVVLLAEHDPDTHRTRYVLAQHYFEVPLAGQLPRVPFSSSFPSDSAGSLSSQSRHENGSLSDASSRHSDASTSSTITGDGNEVEGKLDEQEEVSIPLWYVSTPFEVVCTYERVEDEDEGVGFRPRPLVAVDFGHAVWIEYTHDDERSEHGEIGDVHAMGNNPEQERQLEKRRLRFVSFPPVMHDDVEEGEEGEESFLQKKSRETEGTVRTLEVPEELDLNSAETINIDQSHGAVIVSTKDGKIFILCYE